MNYCYYWNRCQILITCYYNMSVNFKEISYSCTTIKYVGVHQIPAFQITTRKRFMNFTKKTTNKESSWRNLKLRKDKDFIICNFTTMYQHVGLRSIQRITTTDRNKRTERKEKFNPITVWRNGSKSRQTVIILSITILFCRVHPVVLQN